MDPIHDGPVLVSLVTNVMYSALFGDDLFSIPHVTLLGCFGIVMSLALNVLVFVLSFHDATVQSRLAVLFTLWTISAGLHGLVTVSTLLNYSTYYYYASKYDFSVSEVERLFWATGSLKPFSPLIQDKLMVFRERQLTGQRREAVLRNLVAEIVALRTARSRRSVSFTV